MDRPINLSELRPTLPSSKSLTPSYLSATFASNLRHQTTALRRHPYDPCGWVDRAATLSTLGYPELAVGDTHKATRLCQTMLRFLDSRPGEKWLLGSGMGFWMHDESGSGETQESPGLQAMLNALNTRAYALQASNLCYRQHREGRYVPQAYPWLEEKHRVRNQGVLDDIDREIQSTEPSLSNGKPCIEVKRCIFFPHGFEVGETEDGPLGVFATCNLKEDSNILIDKTDFFGCSGPGPNNSTANLNGGKGCQNPLHPNLDHDEVEHDLRWIRERAGRNAADPLLLCRGLLACVQREVKHPLELPAIARLVPAYHRQDPKTFKITCDFAIINDALQQFGIDVFADHNYDTWILFTISARLHNNSWTNPVAAGLNPLFSLFNHSCEPNVEWRTMKDHRTIEMRVSRNVSAGEQLFVEYDSYVHDHPLHERRKRLARWIDGLCLCNRCVREQEDADVS